uniref:Uncharacterized protein n=1 Tax=Anguilla anguilla TaxID=7936 RepID=A0A0E9TNU8_ANGAN
MSQNINIWYVNIIFIIPFTDSSSNSKLHTGKDYIIKYANSTAADSVCL